MSQHSLDFLFHPRSIALVGITLSNPEHWTRGFLDGLLNLRFPGPLYLVNPRGGELLGLPVYRSLEEVPGDVEYVISTVPASAGPDLVYRCAAKGVRVVQFCTSGFAETGEPELVRLEAETAAAGRKTGIRLIGPNCMGIYCPESALTFMASFPKEPGEVGMVSQSGGNAIRTVIHGAPRGLRFSKVISYGNACDLNESDFIEYLAQDPATKVIAAYIEGARDPARFRAALEKASAAKPVVLLKGGVSSAGTRAAAGHTSSLAGSEATWDALCRQLGVIRVQTADELIDVLVTLTRLPLPEGKRALLVGQGGGASVMIADEFERNGLRLPPLSETVRKRIREFTPIAGNILGNPMDYSQAIREEGKFARTMDILLEDRQVDLIVGYVNSLMPLTGCQPVVTRMLEGLRVAINDRKVPTAIVVEPRVDSESGVSYALTQSFAAAGLPVYFTFGAAARAIGLVIDWGKKRGLVPTRRDRVVSSPEPVPARA